MFEKIFYPVFKYDEKMMLDPNEAQKLYGPESKFGQLWKNALNAIESDPQLIAYKDKNNLGSISAAIQSLRNYYLKNEQNRVLCAKLSNLLNMYDALKDICNTIDSPEENRKNLYDSTNPDSLINKLVINFNELLGIQIDKGLMPNAPTTDKKSLLDEAYNYGDRNEYEGAKDPNRPELLLTIRLGQICNGLKTKFARIESAAPMVALQNSEMNKSSSADEYTKFLQNLKQDPAEYLTSLDNERKQNWKIIQDIIAEGQQFAPGPLDSKLAIINGNEEYKKYYEAYFNNLEDEIKAKALQKAEAAHRKNVVTYRKGLKIINDHIKDRDEKLKAIDEELNPLLQERDKYIKDKEPEKQALQNKWDEYNQFISDKNAEIAEISKDVELSDKLAPLLEDRPDDDINSIDILNAEIEDLHKIQEFFDVFTKGETPEAKAKLINAAIGMKDINMDDIFAAAEDTDHPEKLENLQKVRALQEAWRGFKGTYKGFDFMEHEFVQLEYFKGKYKEGDVYGAFDVLNNDLNSKSEEIEQLKEANKTYFKTKETLDKIAKKYPGNRIPDQKDVQKLKNERDQREAPMSMEHWQQLFDLEIAVKHPEIAQLQEKRAKLINDCDSRVGEIESQLEIENKLKTPVHQHVQTDEGIEEEVVNYDKKFNDEHCKGIQERAFIKFKKKHVNDGINNVIREIDKKLIDPKKRLNEIDAIDNKIDAMQKFDDERAAEDKKTTDEINTAIRNFDDRKLAYIDNLIDNMKQYIDNKEKGKQKGHTNTEEFEEVFKKLQVAKDLFVQYKGDGPKPAANQLTDALKNIKKAADDYIDKKLHTGIHLKESNMRHVRLKAVEQIGMFADSTMGELAGYDAMEVDLKGRLENLKPKNTRTVNKGETSKQHFIRCGREMHPQFLKNKAQLVNKATEKQNVKKNNEVKNKNIQQDAPQVSI